MKSRATQELTSNTSCVYTVHRITPYSGLCTLLTFQRLRMEIAFRRRWTRLKCFVQVSGVTFPLADPLHIDRDVQRQLQRGSIRLRGCTHGHHLLTRDNESQHCGPRTAHPWRSGDMCLRKSLSIHGIACASTMYHSRESHRLLPGWDPKLVQPPKLLISNFPLSEVSFAASALRWRSPFLVG